MSSDVDLQTSPPPAVREARRTVSGKTLFLATLGAAALALVLALLAGITGLTWLGFVVPLAYAVYLVALLYLAGRAISFRDRPGEAATSVVLALLLVPLWR